MNKSTKIIITIKIQQKQYEEEKNNNIKVSLTFDCLSVNLRFSIHPFIQPTTKLNPLVGQWVVCSAVNNLIGTVMVAWTGGGSR